MNNSNRTLGVGFGPGYEFNLFTKEEVYKPFINLNKIERVREAALFIPDLLVDLDVTRLAKILPGILEGMSDESKELFSDENVLARLDKRFIDTVAKAIPEAERPQCSADWARFLSKDKIAKADPFVLAYLIPAIIDLMDDKNLKKVSAEIVKGLKPKDFRALTIPDYFNLKFSDAKNPLSLKNNGRTLIFRPEGDKKVEVLFRGKILEMDHTHLHFVKDGEEREYKLYETRSQYRETKDTPNDPNLKIVGEVHKVFKRTGKKNKEKVKFMAVGIPLMLGDENPDIQRILEKLGKVDKIGPEALDVSLEVAFRDVFMKDFSSEDVLYHSWGSLHSKTHGFRAGLRFNISEKPVIISVKQYEALKRLFGEIQPINPDLALYPIDRKADHRKVRSLTS